MRKFIVYSMTYKGTREIVEGMEKRRSTYRPLTTDKGWQVSFRIHSAEKRVIPSLKFDIRLIANPNKLSRHEIRYG